MPMDFDSPWKEVLDQYLQSLTGLCFPQIAAEINWVAGVEMLETELHEIMRGTASGRQHVDKLVRVFMKDGKARRVLVHVEVQHHADSKFAERLFSYHIRLLEKGDPVTSLAILGDIDPKWRPNRFEREVLGSRLVFDFPVCKSLDLLEKREELEQSHDPAAILVVANWAAQITREDDQERLSWKTRLTRRLYERGFQREDILQLYRFIDWVMELPPALENQFIEEILQLEKQKNMPYVTNIERIGKEEGRRAGLEEGHRIGLQEGKQEGRTEGKMEGKVEGLREGVREMVKETLLLRFGAVSGAAFAKLESVSDLEILKQYHRLALTCPNVDDFFRQIE